jgi:hypothetical protein
MQSLDEVLIKRLPTAGGASADKQSQPSAVVWWRTPPG